MRLTAYLAALAAMAPAAAGAASATVETYDSGYYRENGVHDPENPITYTGISLGVELRSFYVFDIAALAGLGPVASATLTFYGENGEFRSDTDTETATLYEVATNADTLTSGTGGRAAFADLGDGAVYGEATITQDSRTPMPELTVDLSAAALDALNALLAMTTPDDFAVGAALTSIDGFRTQSFWGASYFSPSAELTLNFAVADVPVPAAAPLLLAGIGGLLALRRRRRG
ncbi:VPLPA-CTERM sorting domain-containing protein [Rhodovulum sp. DZ06]|uniref:VPLPA-CTERM sorting domain-containing protein n=1 Tax=Rhodovulum sp. DZ06 TaxID=3425126 RepID=UPI003D33E40F